MSPFYSFYRHNVINGEYLNHLRFADNLILVAKNVELKNFIEGRKKEIKININNEIVECVDRIVYLRQEI